MGRVNRNYWTTAATRYAQEERAAHHVERQGFEFYLPRFIDVTSSGSMKQTLMFPGYIFVKVREGWEVLASTRGISRLFMCNDKPSRMSDYEISRLRSREDEHGFVRLHPPVADGDAVLIGEGGGGYAGMSGIVQGTPTRGRVSVLLTLLGRAVAGEFDERVLELT